MLAVERADPGLAGTLLDTAISGERGRQLAFEERDSRRGGTVDIRYGWEGLVGEWEVP